MLENAASVLRGTNQVVFAMQKRERERRNQVDLFQVKRSTFAFSSSSSSSSEERERERENSPLLLSTGVVTDSIIDHRSLSRIQHITDARVCIFKVH